MPWSVSRDESGKAKPLDPDINPWEQQPDETPAAYAAFCVYRDMSGTRGVARAAKSASEKNGSGARSTERRYRTWSAAWSWGYRVYQYDLYMARVDEAEMIRYRRMMNHRQRTAAHAAQAKITRWLNDLRPEELTPMQAARWFELAVRIEREAAGLRLRDGTPVPQVEQPRDQSEPSQEPLEEEKQPTLAEVLESDEATSLEVGRAIAKILEHQ